MHKKRIIRNWHPNFIIYMKLIVGHPNYLDMPNKLKIDGSINWVSPSDKKRADWWDKKIKELGLKNRAEVARAIHPKELRGLKPCQICGKQLSVFYIYPNKITLKKINFVPGTKKFKLYKETIDEIFIYFIKKQKNGYDQMRRVFNVPLDIYDKDILQFIKDNRSSRLSPGVMSNPPDRLDGFHTYNACCRSKQDTGRLISNLSRYTQDRRAYENWADGNWNLSNRLMGEYKRYTPLILCPDCKRLRKMTADHIGPISLGFTHRPKFNPLCSSCNSKKNNRITLQDVKQLLTDEKKGEVVISWHSKPIWDVLKDHIRTERDALLLSKLMRANLHHILILFFIISEAGFKNFLKQYLHPEHSFYDYKFENFNPLIGAERILTKELSSLNKKKNANRYIRISFESLDEYKNKKNRNQKKWENKFIDAEVRVIVDLLRNGKEKEARISLLKSIKSLADDAKIKFDKFSLE